MKWGKRVVLFTLFALNLVDQPAPEVTIDQGVLVGKISKDGTFYEYIGIPYASVNSSARFQAPLPPPKWEEIYRATDEHYSCPQKSMIYMSTNEDCLRINVYVPAATRKPLPVMVFIHGGAFIMGDGGKRLVGPEFLVQRNIIFVSFNYRLGPLGFICLGIKEAPGNAGLKDQVAALRWVKKNIAAFGGDPDNVTLFGESAGAVSTSLLIASPATDGLFKRAIVQSGSSLANWAINRNPVWAASLFAQELGLHKTEDPQELYEFLSKVPIRDLLLAQVEKPFEIYFETGLIHLPCVEKPFVGIEAIIPDVPYNLFKSGNKKNISVIHGTNDNEGLFLIALETEERLKLRNDGYMFAGDLDMETKEVEEKESNKINKHYFGGDPISMKLIMNISEIYTDLYFGVPALRESDVLVETSNAPVYNYLFKYSGGRNLLKWVSGYKEEQSACHADDLFYLFDSRYLPFSISNDDDRVIQYMTILWTNFAKYGDPTPNHLNNLPVYWRPLEKNKREVLYIDKELSVGPLTDKLEKAYRLWNDLYNKYQKTTWGY